MNWVSEMMKNVMWVRLLAVLSMVIGSVVESSAQEAQVPTLSTFAAEWIESERQVASIPGVITAIVVGNEVVMSDGFGYADVESMRLADENTRFRVGSVSKPVTATGTLLAMSGYGVRADTDLRAYFEELPIVPNLEGPITFHNLLTHTGGFSESLAGQHTIEPSEYVDLARYLQTRLPPRFEEPGQVITYNDHHTALAGFAVEQLSGLSFHQFMRQNLFDPLGMTSSSFDQIEIVEDASGTLSQSYRGSGSELTSYDRDYLFATPAAGLATTASDMGRYMQHLLSEESRTALMPDEFYLQQLSVQFRNFEQTRGRSYGFAEGSHQGHLALYKDGQANGFGARMVLVPDLGIGIFVAINHTVLGAMGAPNDASRFLREYTNAILNEAVANQASTEPLPPSRLASFSNEEFAGTYRTTVAARHTWEKLMAGMDSARVEAMPNGDVTIGSGAYVPISTTEEGSVFQWHEGGPYYVGFVPDVDGTPKYLVIGSGSYERVPWYGTQDGAMYVALGVFGAALVFLFGGLFLAMKGHLPKWGKWAFGGSVLRISFFLTFVGALILMDAQQIFYGMPTGVSIAVALALGSILFDALGAISFFMSKSKPAASLTISLAYFSSAGVMVWWLHYWNLLGWRI